MPVELLNISHLWFPLITGVLCAHIIVRYIHKLFTYSSLIERRCDWLSGLAYMQYLCFGCPIINICLTKCVNIIDSSALVPIIWVQFPNHNFPYSIYVSLFKSIQFCALDAIECWFFCSTALMVSLRHFQINW